MGKGGIDGSGAGYFGPNGAILPEPPAGIPNIHDSDYTEPPSSSTTTTPTSEPTSSPTPYYDCKGATLCSTTNVKFCDEAVNRMPRGDHVYTANTPNLIQHGNCWSNAYGYGCSVMIRGTDQDGNDCTVTGDDMWYAYQDIRNDGDCHTCGSKHFGNGCLVSIDYYTN